MRSRMNRITGARLVCVLTALAVAGLVGPAPAGAQPRDEPYGFARGRVTFGGELAGALSPKDDDAFFNYTDYERDALRIARLRIFGQWQIARPLALVGEAR